MNKTIILLHGLHMYTWSLDNMAKKLRKKGFEVFQFPYQTVLYDNEKTLKSLHNFIKEIKARDITLIGHSMGGMVARLYYSQYKTPEVKAIITLGSPHNGSHVAKYLMNTPFKLLMGTSGHCGLVVEIPKWEGGCAMGCVAGISTIGVNSVLSLFHGNKDENDGTVFLREAILENATDSVVVKGQHTQLIISNEVVDYCENFIKYNKFKQNCDIIEHV